MIELSIVTKWIVKIVENNKDKSGCLFCYFLSLSLSFILSSNMCESSSVHDLFEFCLLQIINFKCKCRIKLQLNDQY